VKNECSNCEGEGTIQCPECDGTGKIETSLSNMSLTPELKMLRHAVDRVTRQAKQLSRLFPDRAKIFEAQLAAALESIQKQADALMIEKGKSV